MSSNGREPKSAKELWSLVRKCYETRYFKQLWSCNQLTDWCAHAFACATIEAQDSILTTRDLPTTLNSIPVLLIEQGGVVIFMLPTAT